MLGKYCQVMAQLACKWGRCPGVPKPSVPGWASCAVPGQEETWALGWFHLLTGWGQSTVAKGRQG